VLLVGPTGAKYILMADVGGPTAISETDTRTLTFTDIAAQVLPDSGPIVRGKFRPTSCETPVLSFFAPAPAGPYVEPGCVLTRPVDKTMFGNFGLTNANGTWSLYIRDDNGVPRNASMLVVNGQVAGGWGLEFLAPTSSGVSVSGRVLTAGGQGIRNAEITVTGNTLTTPITVRTGAFGNYNVEGLAAGETYVITVGSQRYTFAMPSRVVTLSDSVTGFDFTAEVTRRNW
jgi:hypothetical protein